MESSDYEGIQLVTAIRGRLIRNIVQMRLRDGTRRWYMEAEYGSVHFARFKVHRTVVPLQDLIGLGQTNPTTVFLGSEVEFKNLVVHLLGNSGALVLNFGHYDSVLAPRRNGQHSSLRHGLHPVDDDVEDGLFHQVGINFDGKSNVGHVSLDGDSVLLSVGTGELGDVFQQAAQIDLLKVKVARPCEINEGLHHPIEAADFAVDDVHMAPR